MRPSGPFVPLLGTPYIYVNEIDGTTEIDLSVVATSIGPIRISGDSNYKFGLPVTWSDIGSTGEDPTDPESLFPEVGIEFQEIEVPGEEFQFIGFCDGDGQRYGQFFGDSTPGTLDPLDTPVLELGEIGPVRNSAGCPRIRNVLKHRHVLRVRSYSPAWNCDFDQLLNACNETAVTITEFDATNVTFNCTYPPLTLEILNVSKSNVQFFETNVVCVEFLIEYNPDGPLFKVLDAGDQAAFVAGAQDPDLIISGACQPGGLVGPDGVAPTNQATCEAADGEWNPRISEGDERLEHNKSGKRDLETSGDILLNGEGVEWCLPNEPGTNGEAIYLAYVDSTKTIVDFNTIPVSAIVSV